MVSDFIEAFPFHLLEEDPAIADQLRGRGQFHGPEADAVVAVALPVAFDPLLHAGAVERRGIVAHGFRIRKNQRQPVRIWRREFAESEAWGLKYHRSDLQPEFSIHPFPQ